ncbi:FAD-dependent monooxygenase [Nonomuraea sp. NPDC050153]|uniref:FAD-dependent monooxygenase n=1 Tax=Nonomuraea sp. NPDC050153 TaxID=3364359 RepID=UPI00378A578B
MTIDVAVIGAGPTGLMLACELSLAGAEPVLLDQLPEPSQAPKANGLVGQAVELMDRRGLLEGLGGASPPVPMPGFSFGAIQLDLSRLQDNPLHGLVVPQAVLERVLIERAHELGVDIRRGQKVTGVSQDASGVTIDLAGTRLRAR